MKGLIGYHLCFFNEKQREIDAWCRRAPRHCKAFKCKKEGKKIKKKTQKPPISLVFFSCLWLKKPFNYVTLDWLQSCRYRRAATIVSRPQEPTKQNNQRMRRLRGGRTSGTARPGNIKNRRTWIIQAGAPVSSRPGSTPALCVTHSANDVSSVLLKGSGWVAKASKWRVMWNIRREMWEAPALNQRPRWLEKRRWGSSRRRRREQGNLCHVSMTLFLKTIKEKNITTVVYIK